jgi:hypothetical protein
VVVAIGRMKSVLDRLTIHGLLLCGSEYLGAMEGFARGRR